MPGTMPYERFDAWKVTHELALAVYAATRAWPRSELYGLTSQLRRAALSAPTNIAEGSAKVFGVHFEDVDRFAAPLLP